MTYLARLLLLFPALLLFSGSANAQCSNVDFSASSVTGCAPFGVSFTASNIPSGAKIEWNLGGGFVSGKDTAFRFFTTAGKKTISLRVTESGASSPCVTLEKKDMIEVLAKPEINLYASDTVLCAGAGSITLIDSTTNVKSREWLINGQKLSNTGTTVTQNYTLGSHSVNLSVTNNNNCEALFKDQEFINVYEGETIEACGTISQIDTGFKASFRVNDFNASPDIKSYSWDLPGGTPNSSTARNPRNILYNSLSQTYDVKVTATFETGCSYTFEQEDFISKYIESSTDSVCINAELEITNLANDGDRMDLSIAFPGGTFIDGNANSKFKLSYPSAGAKQINLTYFYTSGDDGGCATNVSAPGLIQVMGPQARFFSNDKSECAIDSVRMRSNSILPTGGDNYYTWYFFDEDSVHLPGSPVGPTKDLEDFYFPIDSGGVYSVQLKVSNDKNGCVDSNYIPDFLRLVPPSTDFTTEDTLICVDGTFNLVDKTTPPATPGNPYTYKWTIQHVDSSRISFSGTSKNLFRKVSMPGKYTVTHITTSNNKCSDTIAKKELIFVRGIIGSVSMDSSKGCPGFSTTLRSSIKLNIPPDPGNANVTYEWRVAPDGSAKMDDSLSATTKVTFNHNACYRPELIMTNAVGCKANFSVPLACIGNHANFGWDEDSLANLCLGTPMRLTDSSFINPESYKWSADTAGLSFFPSDTVQQPSIIFDRSDSFDIKLVLTGPGPAFCKDSIVRRIGIDAPEAKFSVDKQLALCAPEAITFTNQSINASKFIYDYGDGVKASIDSINHTYIYTRNNVAGFSPRLIAFKTVTSTCADTFELPGNIRIIGPEPEFSMDTMSGCDSQHVEFSNLTSPITASYLFDYGDGSQPDSNRMEPHDYVYPPATDDDSVLYFPTIVASSFGCEAFFIDTVVIYRSPVANFSIDSLIGCRPFDINLYNESDTSLKVSWDVFNNGTFDSLNTDTLGLTLDTVGLFSFRLVAEYKGGCTDTAILRDTVLVIEPPQANFSLSAFESCDSLEVEITGSNQPDSIYLDYGNGLILTDSITDRTYHYTDSLTTNDSTKFKLQYIVYKRDLAACTDTAYDSVVVFRSPVAAFTVDTQQGCVPLIVEYADTSYFADSLFWDLDADGFADGSSDTIGFQYGLGYHNAGLWVKSKEGCSDTVYKQNYLRGFKHPEVDFSISADSFCLGEEVQFRDASILDTNIQIRTWDFGRPVGADTASLPWPSVPFLDSGYHRVSLFLMDSTQCFGTDTDSVYILPSKELNYNSIWIVDDRRIVARDRTVDLTMTINGDFEEIRLEKGFNGRSRLLTSNPSTNLFLIDAAGDSAQFVYYSAYTFDSCGNVSRKSKPVGNIAFNARSIGRGLIRLNWDYDSFYVFNDSFEIYEVLGDSSNYRLLGKVGPGDSTFIDSAYCDSQFVYFVKGTYTDSLTRHTVYSNLSSARALYTAPFHVPVLHNVTVQDNEVLRINWSKSPQLAHKEYVIDRKLASGQWQSAWRTSDRLFLLDSSASINEESYQYRVYTVDYCGAYSDSSRVHNSLLLEGRTTNDDIQLKWNKKIGWFGPYHYVVQLKIGNGEYEEVDSLPFTQQSYTDQELRPEADTPWCYRVLAISDLGSRDTSLSNAYCSYIGTELFLPNAFSPNGDGLNDYFKIAGTALFENQGDSLREFKFQVFNRWGQVIYISQNPLELWDGRKNGDLVQSGAYFYIMSGETIRGESIYQTGEIMVIR